ncbi:hypothetical protein JCM10213_001959 [Rhodosporidiobolus nylandii]
MLPAVLALCALSASVALASPFPQTATEPALNLTGITGGRNSTLDGVFGLAGSATPFDEVANEPDISLADQDAKASGEDKEPQTACDVYDADGYDAEGYGKNGLNKDGVDKDGYNADGVNAEGKDASGKYVLDVDGRKNGRDVHGRDTEGYDVNGKPGYNKDGLNRQGRDRYGLDKDGYDPSGNKCNESSSGSSQPTQDDLNQLGLGNGSGINI